MLSFGPKMSTTFKSITLMLMWFVLNSAFITNAFETYSETDQLAEESIGGYGKQRHEETTTDSNVNVITKETTLPNEDKSVIELPEEDDPIDPLQKILPKVKFNCKGKSEGYYADNEFCRVFHYCKTNGFRFTLLCPKESYYNNKLMACEYNSTQTSCLNEQNKTETKNFNSTKDTSVKMSVRQNDELLEKLSSKIDTKIQSSESVSTTTVGSNKVSADPYLIRRRINYGSQTRPKPKLDENKFKAQNISQQISNLPQNQTILNESNKNKTQTILPFNGFRKLNRNINNRISKNNTRIEIKNKNTDISSISSSTTSNSTNYSTRIASNAWPVLNSIRPSLLNGSNQVKDHRNKSRVKSVTTSTTSTTSTTTTPPPSLLSPMTRGSTTVPPFDYFTPVFNSGLNFESNSDFFPLSLHRRPDNKEKDKTNKRGPHMTQNFYNSIRHYSSTSSPLTPKETQIDESLQNPENNFKSYSQLSYIPSKEMPFPHNTHTLNRSPVFESTEDSDRMDSSDDIIGLSESRTHLSMEELIEKLRQMESHPFMSSELEPEESDKSEVETSIEPNEEIKNEKTGRKKRKAKPKKKFLTVPVLVPIGVSKSDLRRKLSSTLLKPTVVPMRESGEQMRAYVLQFQEPERSRKTKPKRQRSKRQTYNWNPYLSNQWLGNSHYLPMSSMSSPLYSNNLNNYFGNPLPMDTYSTRNHLEIGERPGFRLNPSAQHHIPYYMPPKQQYFGNNFIGHNFYRDNNVYDLSEFSDSFYGDPLNKRPVPLVANDMSPYRAVTLKRPGFKRPPLRQRIPEIKTNKNETKKSELKTTIRPFKSVPVSPRPYSQPIPGHQYLSRKSNPFSDLSDESLNEAIKVFDSSEDNIQPMDPDFNSHPLFEFNSPQSFSSDFIPIAPRARSFGETLNGRPSRVRTYPQSPISYASNNYFPDDFPPLPKFGDPDYRLPYIDIPDPTFTNIGQRSNDKQNNENSNQDSVQRKQDNSSRYSTPYSPEVIYDMNSEDINETQRNPNHNYDNVDREGLQTARTVDYKQDLIPNLKSGLIWDNIVGQYHKHNLSFPKSKVSFNKNDSKESKIGEISANQKSITYGTRLSGSFNRYSQNPEISVKTSVSSVSSLRPEASNQVIVRTKSGISDLSSNLSSQPVNDNNATNIDELYNSRAFDRLMLFNYYNHLNSLKAKASTTTTTTTTTVSPLDSRYPSTSHWSIRGWTGQYYPSSKTTTTSSTTTSPVITTNGMIEYLDLFESETNTLTTIESIETTTERPEPPEPPYKKVFNSHMGATLHSSKYSKPYNFSQKTRSDISNYLSSLTSIKTI